MLRRAAVLAAVFGLLAGPAVAQKSGGTLKFFHRDSPASMSIHEEATISTVAPTMAVFNNLILFNQHEKQNRAEFIEPGQTAAAKLVLHIDPGKAERRGAAQRLDRKLLALIPARRMGQPFVTGKVAGGFLEGALLVGKGEVHR